MHENIRSSTILVCLPSLDTVTGHLQLNFSIADWVSVLNFDHLIKKIAVFDEDAVEDLSKIVFYQVR